jgi:hypothetical protein
MTLQNKQIQPFLNGETIRNGFSVSKKNKTETLKIEKSKQTKNNNNNEKDFNIYFKPFNWLLIAN